MRITTSAQAGSEQKNDVLVTVSPGDGDTLSVTLAAKPIILKQFGGQMEQVIRQVAAEEGISGGAIAVTDGGGALDFVIRARVRTALRRAKGVVAV